MVYPYSEWASFIVVKTTTENVASTIAAIRNTFNNNYANSTFDYFFIDEMYNDQYVAESRFGKVVVTFSLARCADCVPWIVWIIIIHNHSTYKGDRYPESTRCIGFPNSHSAFRKLHSCSVTRVTACPSACMVSDDGMAFELCSSHRTHRLDIHCARRDHRCDSTRNGSVQREISNGQPRRFIETRIVSFKPQASRAVFFWLAFI